MSKGICPEIPLEEHAEQRRNPLPREAFETVRFYQAYNDKFNTMNQPSPGILKEVSDCFGWDNLGRLAASGISWY